MGHYYDDKGRPAGPILSSDTIAGSAARDRFVNALRCPHCGQIGAVFWEENDAEHMSCGPQRRLVTVSAGFHSESGRTQSGDPMIVCSHCDTIQPE